MASSKAELQAIYYNPLPSQPRQPKDYIFLPIYYYSSRTRTGRRFLSLCIILLLLLIVLYIFWPSEPKLKIVKLRLTRVRVRTFPQIAINISVSLTVKVRNANLYSMDYRDLEVVVGYRGKKLGKVKSEDGHIRPRGSSYVDAEMALDGVSVLSDVLFLLADLKRGTVSFDTVTKVRGKLGLFFVSLPLKAELSCEVSVNVFNQTIFRQSCHA